MKTNRVLGLVMNASNNKFDFLAHGGEMGALIRAHDWSKTPLGDPGEWPQSLRVTVRLILNTRHPMFIFWGPELIQFYNDAYAETMGPERHPSALGDRGRECWEEIWPIIGPQIDYVMSGKGSTWDEDRLVPVTRHGRKENVWWTYSYGPIDIEDGVGGVMVVCNDVTEQHLARVALQNEASRLELLFEQAPSFMAILRGPDHVFEFANAAYRKLIGDRELIGKSVRQAVPEAGGQGYFELLDEVLQTGKPFIGKRTPIRIKHKSDEQPRDAFLDFIYQPIVEADGSISGIFVEGTDVTDHVKSERHLSLINGELKHRVKNTLAMVGAIANQTLRGSGNEIPLQTFHARLSVFAKAHDILTASPDSTASIRQVVEEALAPYLLGGSKRISIIGQETALGSKQALSLALSVHELATNATKYGALSNDTGKVEISWGERMGDGADVFDFQWQETLGPKVSPPSRKGFGSHLIQRVLSADLSADVKVDYDPDGFVCRWTAPFENLTISLE